MRMPKSTVRRTVRSELTRGFVIEDHYSNRATTIRSVGHALAVTCKSWI